MSGNGALFWQHREKRLQGEVFGAGCEACHLILITETVTVMMMVTQIVQKDISRRRRKKRGSYRAPSARH